MTEEQASAWLGALLSAKRGLSWRKNSLLLTITSSDESLIDSVAKVTATENQVIKYRDTYSQKPLYQWWVRNDAALAVIERARPYIFGEFASTSDWFIVEYKRRKADKLKRKKHSTRE